MKVVGGWRSTRRPCWARGSWRAYAQSINQINKKVVGGPVDPSFRALSGRLKLTVRRHTSNKDSLLVAGTDGHGEVGERDRTHARNDKFLMVFVSKRSEHRASLLK